MAEGLVSDTNLTAIANAIRTKNGSSDTYTPAEMATAITNIPTSQVDQTTALQWMLNNKTDYTGIAAGLTTLTELPTFTQPAGVTNYVGAFSNCSNLTSVSGLYLGNDTSPIVSFNLAYMFDGCTSLLSLPHFGNYAGLKDGLGTQYMFRNCTSLTSVSLPSRVFLGNNTSFMFDGCTNVTNIVALNNSGRSTSLGITSSENCAGMFRNCTSLTSLNLSNIGATVSYIYSSTQNMFYGCSSLVSISDSSAPIKICIKRTGSMQYTFRGCSSLQSVNIQVYHQHPDVAPSAYWMFYGCSKLVEVSFDGSISHGGNMFAGCSKLANVSTIDLSFVTGSNNLSGMFSSCSSLSSTSLDNILASLATATSYTGTKTLKQIGLSSTQATTCTGLSNWAALSAAGWTTGY